MMAAYGVAPTVSKHKKIDKKTLMTVKNLELLEKQNLIPLDDLLPFKPVN